MATNNMLNVGLSGQTGSGNFVGTNSPTFVTPILGAASATSLAFSSTSEIIGTTTNNSAATGSVGEFVGSNISYASRISLSAGAATNLTSVSLTAGDWNIWGNATFVPAATTTTSALACAISDTSATFPNGAFDTLIQLTYTPGAIAAYDAPYQRYSLSSTTTIYLIVLADYMVSTMEVCGGIYARRTR